MGEKLTENERYGEEKNGLNRRDFFKTAGLVGLTIGAAGAGSLIKADSALAGEETGKAIIDFAVKEISVPPYKKFPYEGAEKLKRYDEANTPFNHTGLSKKEFGGKPWMAAQMENQVKNIKNKTPGYMLIDQAMRNAAWTSYRQPGLLSWEPIGAANLDLVEKVGKWEASSNDNNKYIKKAAYVFGAGATGIAALNEQWIYSKDSKGRAIIFSGKHDRPEVTKDALYIPKKMNRIVVMLAPMDGTVTKYTPSTLAASAVGVCYSRMAELASKMAEFIRGLGYNAIPMGNDTALSVPMAVDAGLGELGRHGLLVNPEYGSLVRICKVLTDMPVTPDKPIEFGVAEFCRTCMKCAEKCPSGSISTDKDPSYDVKCPSNNPGMKKWYVNTWTCLKYWTEIGTGCANCQSVCPYSKPQTWIHDLVKGVSSRTRAFNSTFAKLDNAFGYGSTLDDNDPMKWWNSKSRPKKWPS